MRPEQIKAIARIALGHWETVAREIDSGFRMDGSEVVMLNPRTGDRTRGNFSFNRKTGVWKDWSEPGVGGADLVSLWAYAKGHASQGNAAADLSGVLGVDSESIPSGPDRPHQEKAPLTPVPQEAVDAIPQFLKWAKRYRNATGECWQVKDQDGGLLLLRVRVEPPGKRKQVVPFTWNPGKKQWRQGGDFMPWLYGLERLATAPGAPVLLVEGEKTADAAARLFPYMVALGFMGTSSARKVGLSLLKGREVILWPDADNPGIDAARTLAARLHQEGNLVRLVELPELVMAWCKPGKVKVHPETKEPLLDEAGNPIPEPGGWDLADEAPARVDVMALLQSAPSWRPTGVSPVTQEAEGLPSRFGPYSIHKGHRLSPGSPPSSGPGVPLLLSSSCKKERIVRPSDRPKYSTGADLQSNDQKGVIVRMRGDRPKEGAAAPGAPSPDNHADPASGDTLQTPKASQATTALRLAASAGAIAWLDVADTAFITVPVDSHVEHYRLKSDPGSQAGRWLGSLFYRSERRALGSSAMKDALANLVAEASASKRVFPTARRVARFEGRVFLDLCTPSWEVVEIAPRAWRIIPASEAGIRFTRSSGMLALPVPLRNGKLEALRPFFNCDEDSFRMVVAWALAALSAGREYPVLVFGGEPGAAKSTATRYARALVDPNVAPLRKVPKEEKDLFIAAKNAHVLTFDNLSSSPEWLPDALCALALDTGYACRALYTDDDEVVFRVAAPIILNGISEQLTRSDLADRAFSVTLHRIDPKKMRARDEMDADFHQALPGVLGALLDVLASALDRLPSIDLARLPRMAQSAKLMAAAEPALGWEPGTFARISDQARESVAANVAEGDPLALALAELVKQQGGVWSFTGSASGLRDLLQRRPSTIPPGQVWPPAANHLSGRLRRIAPVLRLQGWAVNPDGRDGSKKNGRVLHLAFPAPAPSDDTLDGPGDRTIPDIGASDAKHSSPLTFGRSDGPQPRNSFHRCD